MTRVTTHNWHEATAVSAETGKERYEIKRPGLQFDRDIRTPSLLQVEEGIRKEERKQLSYALHDGPARQLMEGMRRIDLCVKALEPDQVDVVEELEAARSALCRSLDSMRALVHHYRPAPVSLFLQDTIEAVVGEFQNQHPISLSVELPAHPVTLSAATAEALRAVIAEALFNAQRHGLASSAAVKAICLAGQVEVTVEDNGMGFDASRPYRANERGAHVGLLSLQERVLALGGQFCIQGQPGTGVVIKAILPTTAVARPETGIH